MWTNNQRNKVAEILCRRDGCTREEAEELIQITIDEIEQADDDHDIVIGIMRNNLGLKYADILDLFY